MDGDGVIPIIPVSTTHGLILGIQTGIAPITLAITAGAGMARCSGTGVHGVPGVTGDTTGGLTDGIPIGAGTTGTGALLPLVLEDILPMATTVGVTGAVA